MLLQQVNHRYVLSRRKFEPICNVRFRHHKHVSGRNRVGVLNDERVLIFVQDPAQINFAEFTVTHSLSFFEATDEIRPSRAYALGNPYLSTLSQVS